MQSLIKTGFSILLGVALSLSSVAVYAQPAMEASYPTRAITLIVPFPPGGASDLMARTIGQHMTKKWGQSVVIENKPGAGGIIAASQTVKASPDGYTLLFASSAQLAVNQSIYSKIPYDVERDFVPIALVSSVSNILVANPSVPVKSLAELIKYAKNEPGKLNYASPGSGSTAHLSAELFKSQADTDIMHIPYKGAAGGVTDLLGGQVQLMFVSMPSVVDHVKEGRLRALAVTGLTRSAALPDVPTFAETLPGFEATAWYGIVAPAQTPQSVVKILNAEINAILADAEVRRIFESQGIQVLGSTSDEFDKYIKTETQKWSQVVERAGLKVK